MIAMIEHRERGWCECLSCAGPHTSEAPPPPESTERVRTLPVLTRGECAEWERPCVLTSCRYHLEHGGESCALDVADRGPHYYHEIGALLGVTHQGAQVIERAAIAKLTKRVAHLRPAIDRGRSRSVADRILAELADGPVEASDIHLALDVPRSAIAEAFAELLAAGRVRSTGTRRGTVWERTDTEEGCWSSTSRDAHA